MEFRLTEEQISFVNKVRDFAQGEIAPHVGGWDEHKVFKRDKFNGMAELGLSRLLVPPEYGGIGGDYLTVARLIEELATHCGAWGCDVGVHLGVQLGIYLNGTEEQRRKYLPRTTSLEWLLGFALTEPTCGSDAAAILTTARLEPDHQTYVLDGTKRFISFAGAADHYLVMAKTDRSKGSKGVSAFLVEKMAPGLSVGRSEHKLGTNYSPNGELILDNCRIPRNSILGGEGEGFRVAMSFLEAGRIGVAATAVGIAQAAINAALEFARTHSIDGRPMSDSQIYQFPLVDMVTSVEAARMLVYKAACLRDQGLPASTAASMAKLFASETAMRVTTQAVQICGEHGCSKEYPLERYFREAKLMQIVEGASQIQRLIIARQLFG